MTLLETRVFSSSRSRDAAVLPGSLLHRAPDPDHALPQIDVLPREAQCLALAQAEGQGDGPAGRVVRPASGQQHCATLLAGERFDLGGHDPRRARH